MTPNNRLLAVVLTAAATLVAPRADATIARAISFDEKVETADAIVLGKCVRKQSQWDADRRWIVTHATFQVEKSMKGQPATEVTVVTAGGEVDGIRQDTIGMPAFREGEENVLFVKGTRLGPTVLFADQGAYEVAKNERGERIVRPVETGAVRIDTQRGVAVAPEEPRTLARFETEVKQSIRGSVQRMEIIRQQAEAQRSNSLGDILARNKGLIALALVGAALATIQLLRR